MRLSADTREFIRNVLSHEKTAERVSLFEIADVIFSVPRIESLLQTDEKTEFDEKEAAGFLNQRWNKVANTSLCYTLNTEYPLNWICSRLAESCNKSREMSLLMPTVLPEDIYGNEINSLKIGEFIISDDKQGFIALTDFIDTACIRICDGERLIYVTTSNGALRNLTQNELIRLGPVFDCLTKIYELIARPGYWEQLIHSSSFKLYDELLRLREGLREGDVHHAGHEFEAGSSGYIAAAHFFDYYSTLSRERQLEIERISDGAKSLGAIFGDIRRSQDTSPTAVRYCLRIIGGNLERVINVNAALLRRIQPEKQEKIKILKNKILSQVRERRTLRSIGSDSKMSIDSDSKVDTYYMMDILKNNLIRDRSQPGQTEQLFLDLAKFVVAECQQAKKPQLIFYTNLLLAIGFEAYSFKQRSRSDNLLVLNEIFRRITIVSNFDRTLFTVTSLSDSKQRWVNYVNKLDSALVSLLITPENIKIVLVDRTTVKNYKLKEQHVITTQEIISLRAEEAEQRRRAAEEQRLKAEAEERRAAEERRLKAETEERRAAEEQRLKAEAEERRAAEERRLKAETEERRAAEEQRLKVKGVAFFNTYVGNTIIAVFLDHVVKGNKAGVEKMLEKHGPSLLLQRGRVEICAKNLDGNAVIVEGTPFRLALGQDDDEMVELFARLLDTHYPYVDEKNSGEKFKQYREQFPEEEKDAIARQKQDSKAINDLIAAIGSSSIDSCNQVLNHEEKIAAGAGDMESQKLLEALNMFRNHVTLKGIIKTGKHFNMPLLIEAFKLYDQGYDVFGGLRSPKTNLFWQKGICYLLRFLPSCYEKAARNIRYLSSNESLYSPVSHLSSNPRKQGPIEYWFFWLSGIPTLSDAFEQLHQMKTSALHRIIQHNQAQSQCLIM